MRVNGISCDSSKDFLNLIHEELVKIKGGVNTQKSGGFIIYTHIWDSMLSSGLFSGESERSKKAYTHCTGASNS
jgi:hypothetical protein